MLPNKDPQESVVVKFDFASEMSVIDTATVAVAVQEGEDPDVATMLVGSPQITGTVVYQRVSGGVGGLRYRLRCVAGNNSGDIIVRAGVLPVKTVM